MALLNYTTKIEAIRTAGEIQGILAGHGARAILTEYSDDGHVEALSFKVVTPHGELGIRLPIDPESVLKVLNRQNVPRHYVNHAQAVRISWRILKDWVEAQMAILETEMVRMEQIFLPYVLTEDGRTVFERLVDTKFQLPPGKQGGRE